MYISRDRYVYVSVCAMMYRVMTGSSRCSVVLVLLLCVGSVSSCCTWFYRPDGKECECGDTVGGIISCLNSTGDVGILNSFCLTSNSVDDNTSVVGRCLFILNHGQEAAGTDGLYIKVYPDISEQDNQTCGYLNRQGRLCGSCREHHYVSAYSYDLKCYHCTSGLMSNIVKYLLVAYLPLTLFFVFVILFRISVTSPKMNTVVFTCQLFSSPAHLRYLMQFSRNLSGLAAVKTLATVYGVWNLDFFRTLIPPICLPLHTLQILTLDYLIAIYPLFLVVCFYVLLSLYDRGYSPVLWLYKPFHRCTARLKQQWDIRHSIVDAFATFLLLSYVKLLNTSSDLLIPTDVYNQKGESVGKFVYYDATIDFLGTLHTPYACVACAVLLVLVISPLVLLLLYPMQWFQRCLNKYRRNYHTLRIFMQCFQGYYRDRTDGGRECRYLAALYPAFRVVVFILYSITLSLLFFVVVILLFVILTILITTVKPYKAAYKFFNKLDVVMILLMIVYCTGVLMPAISFDRKEVNPSIGYSIAGLVSLAPLLYFLVKGVKLTLCTLKSALRAVGQKLRRRAEQQQQQQQQQEQQEQGNVDDCGVRYSSQQSLLPVN